MERLMKRILIIIIISLFLGSISHALFHEKWDGWVYPDADNLTKYERAGFGFKSLEDCRNACVGIIRSNNWQNADYECGYKCKFKDGINICKETSR